MWWSRLIFCRGLAAIYAIAFVSSANQFPVLLGERGFEPVANFLRRVRFRDAPSLFHWRYSDRLLRVVAWTGTLLSALIVIGVLDDAPFAVWIVVWLTIWALYMSIVNVGQTFYSFGWESMLLEAGFFAAFLGPAKMAPPMIIIAALRWMLFRTEFGAGLIKLRNDPCWRDLTCMDYHYETQPLPNPTSWYFHRLPKWQHRFGVVFSHLVQIVAPFGLFAPQPVASIAAAFLIFHQLLLIVSGNYSWLNWLTVVLGATGFGRLQWAPQPYIVYAVGVLTLALSIRPTLNFFSRHQAMNYCWNRFHLVCAYGAFGSVTKERYEVILEWFDGDEWHEYEFKGKPGDVTRIPPQVAPYHLRLDWLMWFLPFSAGQGHDVWFLWFVLRLLEGDRPTHKLLRRHPDVPPKQIRAGFYLYQYADEKGVWWKRTRVGEYLPPVDAEVLRRYV